MAKTNWAAVMEDQTELLLAGYKLHKFSNIHWRVTKQGSTKACDVWPTSRKYMLLGTNCSAYYSDIVKTMDAVLHVRQDLKEAQQSVEKLRSGGLEGIIKKYA